MAKTKLPSRTFIAVIIIIVTGIVILYTCRSIREYLIIRLQGEKTVGDILREKESAVKERLNPFLEKAGCSYPLRKMTFLAFKQESCLKYGLKKREHSALFDHIRSSLQAAMQGQSSERETGRSLKAYII